MLLANSSTYVDAIVGWYRAAQVDGHWYADVGAVRLQATESWSRAVIYPDLYRINLDTAEVELVVHSSERDRDWLVSRSGGVLAHTLFEVTTRTTILYAGAAEGAPILKLSGHGRELDLVGQGFTPGTLLIREQTDGKDQSLEVRTDGTGSGEALVDGAAATGGIHDRETGLLTGFGDHQRARMFDKVTEKMIG